MQEGEQMKYRRFGNLDWEVSILGFGAMRLPVRDGDRKKIDLPEATRMIRYAIDHGVNYIDTAVTYHGGTSEAFVGKALRDGYRERVKLATKMPPWFVREHKDFNTILNDQLKRLETDTIDCYLLHGMNKDHWPRLRDLGVLEWAEGAIKDGRIQHLGFSFHDRYELFKEIIDAYDKWEFCLMQYNYMDVEYQAGTKGLRYAVEKGLSVFVMEPLRGGQLAKTPPESIRSLWQEAQIQRNQVEWALDFVWSHPEVSMALSGMSHMQQLKENLTIADSAEVSMLTERDMEVIGRVRKAFQKLRPIPCTNCYYCMPCPNNVDIPHILALYNDGHIYDDHKRVRFLYRMVAQEQQATNCISCGECEEHCPQQIAISEWLSEAHEWLAPTKR